jgi:hypothetical protein
MIATYKTPKRHRPRMKKLGRTMACKMLRHQKMPMTYLAFDGNHYLPALSPHPILFCCTWSWVIASHFILAPLAIDYSMFNVQLGLCAVSLTSITSVVLDRNASDSVPRHGEITGCCRSDDRATRLTTLRRKTRRRDLTSIRNTLLITSWRRVLQPTTLSQLADDHISNQPMGLDSHQFDLKSVQENNFRVESLTCIDIDENRVIVAYFVSFVGITEGRPLCPCVGF